jgi:hypothetical protein
MRMVSFDERFALRVAALFAAVHQLSGFWLPAFGPFIRVTPPRLVPSCLPMIGPPTGCVLFTTGVLTALAAIGPNGADLRPKIASATWRFGFVAFVCAHAWTPLALSAQVPRGIAALETGQALFGISILAAAAVSRSLPVDGPEVRIRAVLVWFIMALGGSASSMGFAMVYFAPRVSDLVPMLVLAGGAAWVCAALALARTRADV